MSDRTASVAHVLHGDRSNRARRATETAFDQTGDEDRAKPQAAHIGRFEHAQTTASATPKA